MWIWWWSDDQIIGRRSRFHGAAVWSSARPSPPPPPPPPPLSAVRPSVRRSSVTVCFSIRRIRELWWNQGMKGYSHWISRTIESRESDRQGLDSKKVIFAVQKLSIAGYHMSEPTLIPHRADVRHNLTWRALLFWTRSYKLDSKFYCRRILQENR